MVSFLERDIQSDSADNRPRTRKANSMPPTERPKGSPALKFKVDFPGYPQ